LGAAALAATATGAVITVLSRRRWIAQPSLRSVSFDVSAADPDGVGGRADTGPKAGEA